MDIEAGEMKKNMNGMSNDVMREAITFLGEFVKYIVGFILFQII